MPAAEASNVHSFHFKKRCDVTYANFKIKKVMKRIQHTLVRKQIYSKRYDARRRVTTHENVLNTLDMPTIYQKKRVAM